MSDKTWVSVNDSVPESDVSVIVYPYINNFSEDFGITGLYCDGEWFCEHGQLICVTHWMPIPNPPEVAK